jgi:ribose transport system permease protein
MATRIFRLIDPRRVSALYLGLIGIVVFAIWIPDLFLTSVTLRTTLADMSITGMAAVAIVMALAASQYDLAVGWVLGFSSAVLSALVTKSGVGVPTAILIALAVGVAVGLVHSFLVVKVQIDSFIVTLGTGAVLTGFVFLVSDNRSQFGLPSSITALAAPGWFNISKAFYAMIVISVIIWFVLEHTPAGRYTRAIGGNKEAARLSGLPVGRYITLALVVSGLVGALAGIFYSASVNGTDPTAGGTFLLPAFSAALFGATQIRPGHPNVWGTVLALLALGIWSKGLNLVGVDFWITDVFFGAALILAVSLRQLDRVGRVGRAKRAKQQPEPARKEDNALTGGPTV